MTSRTLLLPAFLLLVLFYACGKSDSTSTLTGKYIRSKTLLVDDLVLYTKSGAHRDTNMIKDFVARNFRGHENDYYYGKTIVTDHTFFASLEFLSGNKVKLSGRLTEIVHKSDTEILLADLDSTEMPNNNTPNVFTNCDILYAQIPQYNPYSICQAAGGNCKKYRRINAVIISGEDYYIPLVTHVMVGHCNIAISTPTTMANYFNKNMLNGMLNDKDSVLVQISRLPLVK